MFYRSDTWRTYGAHHLRLRGYKHFAPPEQRTIDGSDQLCPSHYGSPFTNCFLVIAFQKCQSVSLVLVILVFDAERHLKSSPAFKRRVSER